MNIDFLFYVFLAGLIVALIQDIKKREVDDWLNLVLIFFGWAYISLKVIFEKNIELFFIASGIFILCFILMLILFNIKFFGGGDAKLLLAMFSLFVVGSFFNSLRNVIYFITLLILSGAIYGLIYILILFFMNLKKIKKEFIIKIKNIYIKSLFSISILFLIIGIFKTLFLFLGLYLLFVLFLFVVGKSMEKLLMIKQINVSKLREGDLLAEDLKVGKKILKTNWNGLSNSEINLLKKYKKNVKIKDGLPFIPAFLIAFILYHLFKNTFLINLIFKIIN